MMNISITQKSLHMKWILTLLLCSASVFPISAQDEPSGQTLDAIVTLQVKPMDDALWEKINARVGQEANTNVEYVCLTTGVLVLRLQKLTVTEKADVMAVVRRILHEAGVKGQVQFLDVHVEPGVGNRC